MKTNDILLLLDLNEHFNSTYAHGLVCVQYLVALNVFLGGDKTILKIAMSEFFRDFFMQAINEMDDRVKLKLDAINDLSKTINNVLITAANKFKTLPKEIRMGNFADHQTENQKFEDDVVTNILYGFKVKYPYDTDHLIFPDTADEIKNRLLKNLSKKIKLDFALNEKDREVQGGTILDETKDLIKTHAGLDRDTSNEVVKLSDFNNDVVELEINNYDLKNRFEQTTNKLIQENNVGIVSKMLVDDIINHSIEELGKKKQKKIIFRQ